MRAITVSLAAERLIVAHFKFDRPDVTNAATAPRLKGVELFADALDATKVIFGTACLDGKKLPLPPQLLSKLSALRAAHKTDASVTAPPKRAYAR